MKVLCRRRFVAQMGVLSASFISGVHRSSANTPRSWRAAIIGCTGCGEYGHGLEAAFEGFPSVEVTAIADPEPNGRARAAQRAKARHQYSDYREMLAQEKPDLVVIAPRWSEAHYPMAMAALEIGAHLLTEKPFTVTLAEADDILRAAQRTNRKVAVAHQMRLSPSISHLQRVIHDGRLGELVQIRSWGKQDARAGGEDMLVLGTHVFDMMRLFAGDALSCSAQIFDKGRAIKRSDRRAATEKIGPVAGDEIQAHFEFDQGITASFTSRGRLRETLGPWAVELIGSKGAIRIKMDIDPLVLQRQRVSTTAFPTKEEWLPLDGDPMLNSNAEARGFGPANQRVVRDWLDAIENDRPPRCSGENATKALEMVMAVYKAGLGRTPVTLPLAAREHPLG